jgi:shikimate dehydrogenase
MRKCGLLGAKLTHSFSPRIHSYLGDYEYLLYEKQTDELEDFIKNGDYFGLNVTIPYKKDVIPFCDELSSVARRIGSVNTLVKNAEGYIYGDNTDYAGFEYMLQKSGIQVTGKKVLVLGSGGASLTVQTLLKDKNVRQLTIISRSGEDNYENIAKHADTDVIVNTTPVGMYPNHGQSPIDLSIFKNCSGVLDVIYNPAKTALLLDAEDMGIPCINGLSMLVAQAVRASERFLSNQRDDSKIDSITSDIARQTKNIALIGMPGCGKTTTGRALAKRTGRTFVDVDALIVEKAGQSIPDIFAESGEAGFRKIETEVLASVAGQSGLVIATGGGVVTRPENRRLLRQNSTIVFLDRKDGDLPTEGRPISQSTPLADIAAKRIPLYRSWSTHTVICCGADKTAAAIQKELML